MFKETLLSSVTYTRNDAVSPRTTVQDTFGGVFPTSYEFVDPLWVAIVKLYHNTLRLHRKVDLGP